MPDLRFIIFMLAIIIPIVFLTIFCSINLMFDLAIKYLKRRQRNEATANNQAPPEGRDGVNMNVYNQSECPICVGPLNNSACLECNHLLCLNCSRDYISSSSRKIKCPLCRKECNFLVEYIENHSPENDAAIETIRGYNARFGEQGSGVSSLLILDLGTFEKFAIYYEISSDFDHHIRRTHKTS